MPSYRVTTSVRYRATYATLDVRAQLAPEDVELDLEWAANVGDVTDTYEFEIRTADPRDGLIGIQAFDVGEYGHEVELNGETLSGFDLPPGDGWQYWVDSVTGSALREGVNAIRIRRNSAGDDAFAVGTVVVHWKEPLADADAETDE